MPYKHKEDRRANDKRNKERILVYNHTYLELNKDRINERRRQRYQDDPTRFQGQRLQYLYDLDTTTYEQMYIQQEGLCKICGGMCLTGRKLSVDHDHTTGKVRGLLCGNCNTGLGKFKDNPTLLNLAIAYLKDNT